MTLWNGADPDLIRANITKSVRLLDRHNTVVVLAGMRTRKECWTGYAPAFQEIYRDVAAEHEIILVPDFLRGLTAASSLTQEDGLHPTAEGYDVIVQTMYPYVMKAIESLGGIR